MKQPLGVTASNFHTVGVADGWRYGYEYFAFPRLAPPPTKSEFSEAGNRAVLGGPEFRARPSSHPAAPSLSDAQAPKRARKEYAKGVDALAANKLDQARTHLGKAVAEYPCYARPQTDLAMVLSEQQKLAEAEAAVRKASACDPGFTESYLQLGLILNQEKKFAESEAALKEGVRQAPGQWRFHYELAAAHYGEKQFAKAEQDYQRVLALNATPPAELRVKLANVYLDEHRFDKAYEQMQEYLKAEPEGPLAEKIKKVMQKMRASGVVRP